MVESSETKEGKVVSRIIEEEMKQSYLDYAMSVIVGRALPDVRDGLKPVHRRVLYGMMELGLEHSKPFKKCARIVGEVLGKFHPHGDVAVYDTLVRLAQTFSMRYLLVDGQGNFGSIDGDNPAAMRYTEARLSKIAEEILKDIDKDTVNFSPNFDNTLKEPVVLPSAIPNLLINGSSGIAVGMTTNVPPHNISEICSAVVQCIDNPEISSEDLLEFVPGPDFPTGGIIYGTEGIRQAYLTGRGHLTVRARTSVEENRGRQRIIVSEIPFQVNKSQLLEEIAELVKDKKIIGISDIRDESDRDGMRIVFELKTDANSDVVLNQLFKLSKMQTTFGVIMLALVENKPRLLTLKNLIRHFIEHRKVVVVRRTQFELKKAEDRLHILNGLIVALENIDAFVVLIKGSKDAESAKLSMISRYKLSEEQAKAILDMRLQRLAALEQKKIREEKEGLVKDIARYKEILSSDEIVLDIIKDETNDIIKRFGDARRTKIMGKQHEIGIEDTIEQEDVLVTCTHGGYIKRIPLDFYRQQHRGGKGITATEINEQDFVEHMFIANTHSYLMLFTNKGKVHWLKVYNVPSGSRYAKGKPLPNLIEALEANEKIAAMISTGSFENKFLVMITKNGIIKKTELEEFSRPRKGGIIAISLEENDELIEAKITSGKDEIIIATANGIAVRFNEHDVRSIGRAGRGVRAITLKGDDVVIGMAVPSANQTVLSVTENGFGKRSLVEDYRLIARGGKGVINIKVNERNSRVANIKAVSETDEVMLISQKGILIRCPVRDISVVGRNTQGVRIMRLEPEDRVVAVEKVIAEPSEPSENDSSQSADSPDSEIKDSNNSQDESDNSEEK